MTPGSLFPDDDWADLRSELGLESATPAPAVATPEPDEVADSEPVVELAEEVTYLEVLEPDEAGGEEAGTEEGEDAGAEEGEVTADGEPKKKRRRRRRRGRKPQEGEEAGPDDAAEAGEDTDEPAAEVDDESPEAISRQLVENWDVPSWSEIVAGLYRPGR